MPRWIYISGSLLLFAGIGLFFLIGDRRPPLQSPADPGLGVDDAAPNSVVLLRAPEDSAANGGTNPSTAFEVDPREAVDRLAKNLSGHELEIALMEAAVYYREQGVDKIKEFVLALPVGSVSASAITEALKKISVSDAPHMTEWVAQHSEYLGNLLNRALRAVTATWAKEDLGSSVKFIADDERFLLDDWRWVLASEFLESGHGVSPQETVGIVNSIENDSVRQRVKATRSYIREWMEVESAETVIEAVAGIENQELRRNSLFSIASLLRESTDKGSLMNAMISADCPEKNEVVARMARHWMKSHLNEGLEWVSTLEDAETLTAVLTTTWHLIAETDPEVASMWISQIPDQTARQRLEDELSTYLK